MNLLKRAWDATANSRPARASMTRQTILELAQAELRTSARGKRVPGLVLVDGRSGSGKTQFAHDLGQACPTATVLHLDDLYPNWEGLHAGVERAAQLVAAWSRGESPEFTPTQWPGLPARSLESLKPDRPLIVEGVGARRCLPDPTSAVMPLTIYLDVPEELRRERALDRDGDAFAPYWESWATQEDAELVQHPLRSHDSDLLICRDSSFGDIHA